MENESKQVLYNSYEKKMLETSRMIFLSTIDMIRSKLICMIIRQDILMGEDRYQEIRPDSPLFFLYGKVVRVQCLAKYQVEYLKAIDDQHYKDIHLMQLQHIIEDLEDMDVSV